MSGRKTDDKPRAPGRKLSKRVGPIAAQAAVWIAIVVLGFVTWAAVDLPDVDDAVKATRRPTVTILAADGQTIATFGDLYGRPIAVAELPRPLIQAVLSSEDRWFYSHLGLDPFGLARAAYVNFRAGRVVQGGSTITQQVAKVLFLSPERTFKRKVQELFLAFWLEAKFTKDEILTIYLNRVYLGAGTFGVEAASQRYFGVSAKEVSLHQAALLAGLVKAPSRYSPTNDPKLAAARAAQVLASMVDAGYLTFKAAARAGRTPLAAAVVGKRGERLAQHFADWIFESASDYVSGEGRDIVIATTLDMRLQRLAEDKVATLFAGPARAANVGEVALVALSPDGAVKAMIGGRSYRDSQFNRATSAVRQPGSAFKPIVYLAALESGLTPQTRFDDAPITIGKWSPQNFDGTYMGPVTMDLALARSLNTVAVRIGESVGWPRIVQTAARLGITTPLDPTPALSLGASDVSPLELTQAFAAFANGGHGVWAYAVREIRDSAGRVVYRRGGTGAGRVVALEHVAQMNAMLGHALTEGTGRAATLGGRPAAGKTGTSTDFRDAWFVGYTADVVTGVWLGNDGNEPMKNVTGGGLPARLWREFMAGAHEGLPPRPLAGFDGSATEIPGLPWLSRD
ncbi:MAG: PBP1A family penicillin-binding protein [Rhodospirillales bacterium]|nr:PBP1A family penicillin-binding protein [Rhodospirillales bacterium]